jgi:PAS domain S-box-containing protein
LEKLIAVDEVEDVTSRKWSSNFYSLLLRYGTATFGVALVLCLKESLNPILGQGRPFRLFSLMVVVASWFGGRKVGIYTAFLSAIAAHCAFIAPDHPLVITSAEAIQLSLFLIEVLCISWLTASLRPALDRARRSEQLYRLLADNIPQLIWMARADGSTIYRNQRYYSYTGARPEEMVGMKWQEHIHPEDLISHMQRWTDSQRSGQPFDTQCRIRGTDGVYRWFLVRSLPVSDSTGKILRWFGTATDVDQERRAVEAQAQLAAIVTSSDDAIISVTLDGTITSWNRGAEETYGYTAAEVIGGPISVIVPANRFIEVEATFEKLRLGKPIERYDTERVHKEGHPIPISLTISPIRDAQGSIVGASAIGRDITERKRAEQVIRQSEELFHSIADNAPVMIWMTDTQGQRTFCNKFYQKFTGRTMEQERGRGWMDQIHIDDQSGCLKMFQEASTQRQGYQMEFRLGRADGQFRWVLETGVPRFDSDHTFLGYIATCVDISDRKWSEQVLRGAYDELEDQVAETSVELAESNESLRAEAAKRKAAEATLQKWGLK